MYFFTADEHYSHKNIIIHCDRPFESAEEMDSVLIENHNSIVKPGDTVIHGGDFCFTSKQDIAESYLKQLNGNHIVLRGSHDYWLKDGHEIWEKKIEDEHVVVCHYAMRVWPRSHFNSWQLYGHSHGRLDPVGKQWDVGVDNNNYHPVSFEELKKIMSESPDNPNRLLKFNEDFTVPSSFLDEFANSILESMRLIDTDYGYEHSHIVGSLLADRKKLLELSKMSKMYNILNNLWDSLTSISLTMMNIPADQLTIALDFQGSRSDSGVKLKRFVFKNLEAQVVPEPRAFERTME